MTERVYVEDIQAAVDGIIAICRDRDHDSHGNIIIGAADDIRITWWYGEGDPQAEVTISPQSRGNGAHAVAYDWVRHYVYSVIGSDDREVYPNVDTYGVCVNV